MTTSISAARIATPAMAMRKARAKDEGRDAAAAMKKAPSISIEPCARLMTFITPKASDTPIAIRNSTSPNWRPLNPCPSSSPAATPTAGRAAVRGSLLLLAEHRADDLPRPGRRLVGRGEDRALLERHPLQDHLLLLDQLLVLVEGAVDAGAQHLGEVAVVLLEAAGKGPEVMRRLCGLRRERVQH